MQLLFDLKTGHKLAVTFGICLLMAVAIAGVAAYCMTQQTKVTSEVLTNNVHGLDYLANFNSAARRIRTLDFQLALAKSPKEITGFEHDISTTDAKAVIALSSYHKLTTDSVDSGNTQSLSDAWTSYLNMQDTLFIPLINAGQIAKADTVLTKTMRPGFLATTNTLDKMLQWNVARGQWYARKGGRAFHSALEDLACMLFLAILVGGLSGILISRYITGAISQMTSKLEALNANDISGLRKSVQALEIGDLSVKSAHSSTLLQIRGRDEFGTMAKIFNEMQDGLGSTITSFSISQKALNVLVKQLQSTSAQMDLQAGTLVTISTSIGSATEEITETMNEVALASEQSAQGAGEVAKGSSLQAKSIAEGADRVRELAVSVHGVANDSETALQAAVEATQSAELGAHSVRETVAGMHATQQMISNSAEIIQTLGVSSKQIGTIVQTIEDIADQTNLLALNAAIEAARAGTAGRGFAVVADEVRKLAERSRTATEEIAELIDSVQSQTQRAVAAMESGVSDVSARTDKAELAGAALTQIQNSVASVMSRVQNICNATEEIKSASDSVTRSMTDVAAVVEESSAAAEQMSASTDEVSASVSTVAATTNQQHKDVSNLVISASSLSSVATSLSELISKFKLDPEAAAETQPIHHREERRGLDRAA
jgi:methyl-accepting chemotaxis protein